MFTSGPTFDASDIIKIAFATESRKGKSEDPHSDLDAGHSDQFIRSKDEVLRSHTNSAHSV